MEQPGTSISGEEAVAVGRRCLPRGLLAAALLAAAGAGPSRADEPQDHWEAGEPRPFLSGRADVGSG